MSYDIMLIFNENILKPILFPSGSRARWNSINISLVLMRHPSFFMYHVDVNYIEFFLNSWQRFFSSFQAKVVFFSFNSLSVDLNWRWKKLFHQKNYFYVIKYPDFGLNLCKKKFYGKKIRKAKNLFFIKFLHWKFYIKKIQFPKMHLQARHKFFFLYPNHFPHKESQKLKH